MDYKVVQKESYHSWMQVQFGFTAVEEQEETGIEMFTKQLTKSVPSQVMAAHLAKQTSTQIVKTGVRVVSKNTFAQSLTMVGEEAMIAGVGMVSKEMVTRSVSSGGQEVVKTGIRTVTKEVIEETVSTAGKEVVKTASSVTTSTTTKEVLTQSTSKSVSNTVALGVACGAVIEGISAYHDISCARENMKEGKISSGEYYKFVGKRVMTGFGSFGGSSLGTLLGQVAIPYPFVGGLVGSVVGGLVGSVTANITANAALE